MSAKIVDGRKIAAELKEEISKKIKKLNSKNNLVPNITTIKIGDNPESNLYLKLRNKACSEVGIKTNLVEFDLKISEKEVINTIKKLNNDGAVHGILIQFPVPKHISASNIINSLEPTKDVEGFHPVNMGNSLLGEEKIVPCTPLAVLKILEYEKTKLKGADIAIVNHSNIVGKPLTALLLNRNASVSVCHVFTKDLASYTKKADILISAAGVANLINSKHIKKNCFVIDVGIINTEEGITGDVDFDDVKSVAGKITPVPGGVGPVTVACSLENMVKTTEYCI
jgi:methylenetetrahydrofolate dehydrogenase (NADP+)/methenyltetrahydrofolate cyclohydrolase